MRNFATFEQMTKEEMLKFLEENPYEFVKTFLAEEGSYDGYELEYDIDIAHGIYTKCVHSKGGEEGGGDYAERCIEIFNGSKATGVIFRITGHYASHYGCDWDSDFDFVEPRQVTVTQYHPHTRFY